MDGGAIVGFHLNKPGGKPSKPYRTDINTYNAIVDNTKDIVDSGGKVPRYLIIEEADMENSGEVVHFQTRKFEYVVDAAKNITKSDKFYVYHLNAYGDKAKDHPAIKLSRRFHIAFFKLLLDILLARVSP